MSDPLYTAEVTYHLRTITEDGLVKTPQDRYGDTKFPSFDSQQAAIDYLVSRGENEAYSGYYIVPYVYIRKND